MRLRAPCTQMLQMFWAIGAIIVQAVTYQYNEVDADIAYKYVLLFMSFFPLSQLAPSASNAPHVSCVLC